jgi:hypothetical protein
MENNNIITLTNGKRVANFSSPHPFTFTDGSILPAVSNEDAKILSINFNETIHENGDVELEFELTQDVSFSIGYWMRRFENGEVDVVYCPLPMLVAMKNIGFDIKKSPFRSIRIEDRINKLVSIDKQCI